MNDELEIRLHNAFGNGSLPAAPASLRDALERVPDTAVRQAGAGRSPWGILGLAAVLLIGGSLALAVGSRGPAPQLPPSSSPSPTAVAIRLTYEALRNASEPEAALLARTVEIIQGRLDATGLVGHRVSLDDQRRIVVDLPPVADLDEIRRLIGPTGEVGFVPLDGTVVERGTRLDPADYPPLIDSSEVSGAMVVGVQIGQPALQILFTGTGGEKFGAYTAAHIGSAFAIVFDGIVVAAPYINEAIRDGIVLVTFGPPGGDPTELARLAAMIRLGPLPVAIAEVGSEPAPSASAPVAADPPIRCGPRVDVGGLQLECDPAVRAALAFLPADHPQIKEITFSHGCPEIPGRLIDCATQMFGIVTINFTDASSGVRILVDFDLKASYLPGSSAPGTTVPLKLNVDRGDVGCDTIRVAYRSLTFRIDPSAADPVQAIGDNGHPLRTWWSASFRGGTSTDPVVYDLRSLVVARDGTRIDVPEAAFPTLAGYFVCPSPDAIYVFDQVPPA